MFPSMKSSGTKNSGVAYILWATGGPLGLHHIYLGRRFHAFLWWATYGGFMMGWIRDMWRIPDYVEEANESTTFVGQFIRRMKVHKAPPISIPRLGAEFFFAMTVGVAVMAGLPKELTQGQVGMFVRCTLVPATVALAVFMVANIGKEQATIKWSLIGAYLTIPLFIVNSSLPGSCLSHCSLASTLITNWKGKSWRRTQPPKRSPVLLVFAYGFIAIVYASLWCSAVYNNAYLTTGDGEKIKLKDAFQHIQFSQAWTSPLRTVRLMWATYKTQGLYEAWREFVNAMDPEGEKNAFEVLGVPPGAPESTVKQAYRSLVKKYHPDRDDGLSEEFMQIQKAYDTLSSIQARRNKANMKSRTAEDERDL